MCDLKIPGTFGQSSLAVVYLNNFFNICLVVLLFFCHSEGGRKLPGIYWNSTNPIFRIDNTDHVLSVRILDRLSMICPYYSRGNLADKIQMEYSEIYRVPRWGYDNCELTKDAHLAGVCITPQRRAKISIVFREFTPLPNGLEFKPGHAYYFISTSNGSLSGLSNRRGGLCLQKNLKLKVEVEPTGKPVVPDSHPPATESSLKNPLNPVLPNHDRRFPSDEQHAESSQVHSHQENVGSGSEEKGTSTPLMYIIHNQHPEDYQTENQNQVEQGYRIENKDYTSDGSDDEENDDGGATSQSASAFIICLLPILVHSFYTHFT